MSTCIYPSNLLYVQNHRKWKKQTRLYFMLCLLANFGIRKKKKNEMLLPCRRTSCLTLNKMNISYVVLVAALYLAYMNRHSRSYIVLFTFTSTCMHSPVNSHLIRTYSMFMFTSKLVAEAWAAAVDRVQRTHAKLIFLSFFAYYIYCTVLYTVLADISTKIKNSCINHRHQLKTLK